MNGGLGLKCLMILHMLNKIIFTIGWPCFLTLNKTLRHLHGGQRLGHGQGESNDGQNHAIDFGRADQHGREVTQLERAHDEADHDGDDHGAGPGLGGRQAAREDADKNHHRHDEGVPAALERCAHAHQPFTEADRVVVFVGVAAVDPGVGDEDAGQDQQAGNQSGLEQGRG